MSTLRWLSACAALAAGEYLAAQVPSCAAAWPFLSVLALLVALFGHGLSLRGWPWLFLFLVGMALFLRASMASEELYREKPWLRTVKRHASVGPCVTGVTACVRRELARRVAIGLGHDREAVALNRAILLGERSALPWQTRRIFVESGTMHVFAISGLHVMVVAGVLRLLLAFVFMPCRWAGAVALPFLWGYVHVIGDAPSAVRAALMASFCYLAPVFWRRPNGLVAWALTFLMVHVCSPRQIDDVGSALSFAVMLAILLAVELVRGVRSRLVQSLLVSLAAWAAGVPIAAHVFGRITPGGLLANLILLPTAEAMVGVGTSGLAVSFISEGLAAHLNNLAALFTSLMVGVAGIVARLPGANLEVAPWSAGACLTWYAALVLVLTLVRLCRHRRVF